jgi:hypothetical protein
MAHASWPPLLGRPPGHPRIDRHQAEMMFAAADGVELYCADVTYEVA